MASSATSIARSRKAALCPRRYGGPTMRNRKSARASSMCSLSKKVGWGYSSQLSGSPEQRPRSEWPISSTTSNALSSCARSPSHDPLVLRKAPHSSQYQIPIKPNQQPVSADLWHAEHNSLIELSSFLSKPFPRRLSSRHADDERLI